MPIEPVSQNSPDKNTQPKSMADLGLPKPLEEASMTAPVESPVIAEPAPEVKVEVAPEVRIETAPVEKKQEIIAPAVEQVIESTVPSTPTLVTQTKDELSQQIEEILSANLSDDYKKMPPALQQKFKQEGEVTAQKIKTMLESGKVKFKKIVDLLLSWLKIIPGLDKYFLHQEAKIKADKLIHLREGSMLDDK